MDTDNLLALIRTGEGHKLEFKESLSAQDEAIKTLCAFANADGGFVVFGVKDDGAVRGVTLGANTLANFANRISQHTDPKLIARLQNTEVNGQTVVYVEVDPGSPGQLFHAFNTAYVRVGKTNQVMSPDQQRSRLFAGYQPDVTQSGGSNLAKDESWSDREARRIERYEKSRGLFLVHVWKPSSAQGQIADIVISLRQHVGPDMPLPNGAVKSVEYHLGPKFSKGTFVANDAAQSFRLEVSAYGPMLCLARVNFDDGHAPLDLERYIDF